MPFLERPDGARLHLHVHGPEGAPALLLLEGMGGDLPGWRRILPLLVERVRVVAFDHRGNGGSVAEPGPWTMATFVEDAVAVLDHVGVEEAHLYGESLGGMVAQELALTHPGRVRSLLLGCTHAGVARAVPSRARAPKDEPWRLLYAPGFPEEHPEHVREDLAAGIPQPPEARRRQWEAMQAWEAWDRLSRVRAPTLVLHGTEDLMTHPDNARLLAERILEARLVLLEGTGHVFHSERPRETVDAILGWIDEARSG